MYTVRNNTIHFEVKKHMNEQKNSTKTQIKQATIRQIEKFGIDKTSMRSIAAEANMTTGAIYYYYKNKQDLFDEIVTDSIHFAHRIFHENENEKITIDSLFSNVEKEARIRFKRLQEEKLYLLLLSDAMKCDSEFSQKYTSGLKSILDQAATINMALSRNGCVMDSELCRLISRNWLFPNPFNAKDADGKPFDMFYEDKVKRFKEEGIEYTIRQIDEYRALGVDGIHLYALNKWKDVSEIIDRSGLRTLI